MFTQITRCLAEDQGWVGDAYDGVMMVVMVMVMVMMAGDTNVVMEQLRKGLMVMMVIHGVMLWICNGVVSGDDDNDEGGGGDDARR